MRWRPSSILALAAVALATPASGGGELTDDETRRLFAGDAIQRPQTVPIGERRYIGGLAYAVIETSPDELTALLSDERVLEQILPRTKHVARVSPLGRDTLYQFAQGNALVTAEYTLRVRHEPEAHRIRFWLERSRPHAIDDAWGFFRYEPFEGPKGPAVLLSYGVLVDLGSGVAHALYEDRIRALALTVPGRLREYLSHRPRGPGQGPTTKTVQRRP